MSGSKRRRINDLVVALIHLFSLPHGALTLRDLVIPFIVILILILTEIDPSPTTNIIIKSYWIFRSELGVCGAFLVRSGVWTTAKVIEREINHA